MKIGVLPDRVLMSLMNDRMIAKGTILEFITWFFKDYLATDSMDDLVQLLRKARLDDRLLDFFPPQKRNLTEFDAHFKVQSYCLPRAGLTLCCKPLLDSVSCMYMSRLQLVTYHMRKAVIHSDKIHAHAGCCTSGQSN